MLCGFGFRAVCGYSGLGTSWTFAVSVVQLEYLLEMLTDEDERMPTAALAQVSLLIDTWAQLDVDTVGKLVRLWRPRELPEGL